MIPPLPPMDPDETQAILSAALHEMRGDDARLVAWTLDNRFTENGKRRVVRFDLKALVAGAPYLQQFAWLGKFYDSDEDARRVASILGSLAALDHGVNDGLAVPRVLGYHAPRRLLMLTFESGEPAGSAIAHDSEAVLKGMGRALATLHAAPLAPARIISPTVVLDDLRPRIEDLRAALPGEAASLQREFLNLEQEAPPLPTAPSFVHGDFGPANLLWRPGQIVVLDFDKCGRGDPALDLGNLFTQLFRISIRKPERLRDFASARATVLESYRNSSPVDAVTERRVAWYERAISLRKIHRLVVNTTGSPEGERRVHDETNQLLRRVSSRWAERTRDSFPKRTVLSGADESAKEDAWQEPAAPSSAAFPVDPDFPQLAIAGNPKLMADVFRAHLRAVAGQAYRIEDCVPFRFRCRQGTSRCVLQYTLHLVEPNTGRRREQWVTGVLCAEDGKAERIWRQLQSDRSSQEMPAELLTFEPLGFIPDLQMLVEVFPFDRRLPNLGPLLGGALRQFEPLLLGRLGLGEWHVEERTIEPTRYRTELGAALRYTIWARDGLSGRRETLPCYVKVYRNERGAETFHLLQSLPREVTEGKGPYGVARPIAYLGEPRALALEEAPGRSLADLLREGSDSTDALQRAARAAAAFNQDVLPITRRESLGDQLEDVKNASTLVQWACPDTRVKVQGIVDALVEGLDEVPPGPIHGDLKPDHVFVSRDRVTFIDLDSAALGDPVRDPAHLVAYVIGRVGLDSTTPSQAQAVAETFVEEYFRQVPGAWRGRFSLHLSGALIEVAGAVFRRQESGWAGKIAEVIEAAEQALSGAVG